MSARDPKMARRTNLEAFTLVELLVVIAIIAVILGILLPSLGGARDNARTLRCLANVRSTAQALVLYHHDYKERFPHWSAWQTYQGDGSSNEDTPGPGWAELVEDHLGTLASLGCPARADKQLPVAQFLQSRYTARLHGSRLYTSLSAAQVQLSQQFVLVGEGTNPTLYAEPFGAPHRVPNFDPDDARWQAVFYPGETRPHGPRGGGKSEESADPARQGSGRSNLAYADGSAETHARFRPERQTWHGTEMRSWADATR